MNTININERELRIAYLVDLTSTYDIATQYGVDVKVIRNALKTFGITVRRNEVIPFTEQTTYTLTRVDGVVTDLDGNVVTNTTTEPTNETATNWDRPVVSLYAEVPEPSFN
tara:strand:+ start:100 stop:432 length:333 start_codon:yes stop_codon:yes gene_type:complete